MNQFKLKRKMQIRLYWQMNNNFNNNNKIINKWVSHK